MQYHVVCACGQVLSVSEGQAGSTVICNCRRQVLVPALSVLCREAITEAAPSPTFSPLSAPAAVPDHFAEIIPPTHVTLQTEGAVASGQTKQVMIALTAETLWIQETWQTRTIRLHALENIEPLRSGKVLVLTLRPQPSAERLTVSFTSAAEGERWRRELQLLRQQATPETARQDRYVPEGVSLIRRPPDVHYTLIGRVINTDKTPWAADRGLQLRAGILGADAVIEVHRHKGTDGVWGARHVVGMAVRVEDAADRQRLRLRWYSEDVRSLVNYMLVFLVIQAALLFAASLFFTGGPMQMPTGETLAQALVSNGLGFALVYAWPFLMLVLLRVSFWPRLVRTAGLAVLAATTIRGLTVYAAHAAAVAASGAGASGIRPWMFLDPIDWAFIIIGICLCVRAWRLAANAVEILPREVQAITTTRVVAARALFAVTGAYALALICFVGVIRYQASAHLAQPGVDPRREHQALLALNEGIALGDKGEFAAADQALQRSLNLWEQLTATRAAPPSYRRDLAVTLSNLGWTREQQGRADEADKYYDRANRITEELAGDRKLDDAFKQTLAETQRFLAGKRTDQVARELDAKGQAALRKYEDAQVHGNKGAADAELLYRDAIQIWEEVLSESTNETYKRWATAQLATASLQLGELQSRLGKGPEAEKSLHKAINYGEKTVAQEPNRPLPKHNLEVARQLLDGLREQALDDDIGKLIQAERFAEAFELWRRSITDHEEQLRVRKNDATQWRLAFRLDRFAWHLAHCSDQRHQDTKAAVRHARRATELQPNWGIYWHTLATVQFRNHDWADSLKSLDQAKAKFGVNDGAFWLLTALNSHHLRQSENARVALRKADDWLEQQGRQAEGNDALKLQIEAMRRNLEPLRREAEKLIGARDASGK